MWAQSNTYNSPPMSVVTLVSCWFLLISSGCSNLDCIHGGPDVFCASGWSCNPGTRRCEKNCEPADAGCVGGWQRQCAPRVPSWVSVPDSEISSNEDPDSDTSCFCRKHSDCKSGLCDNYATPGSMGKCEPLWFRVGSEGKRHVLYVNADRCIGGAGDGSPERPYCKISQALTRIELDGYSHPIRIMSSTSVYDGFVINSSSQSQLQIVGPDTETGTNDFQGVRVNSPIAIDGQRFPSSGFVITTYGINILNSVGAENAIRCTTVLNTVRMNLKRITIGSTVPQISPIAGAAVFIKGCQFSMDRSAIINNSGRALFLQSEDKNGDASTSFSISNSIIANNHLLKNESSIDSVYACQSAVCLAGAGSFRYNTIANNGVMKEDKMGIRCGGGNTKLIENSIIINNPPDRGQQFDYSSCSFSKVVVGSREMPPSGTTGLITQDPQFASTPQKLPSDYQLATGDTVARDKATRTELISGEEDTQRWDFRGSVRPSDSSDIGALEK